MCGLIGVADAEPLDESIVMKGLAALSHRGPDSQRSQLIHGRDWACVLGSARLRVIDNRPVGDQPLSNEGGDVWISYNGELYNHDELRHKLLSAGHKFRSQTDTEALVHLYEEEDGDPERFLNGLRGMFGIAIFDASKETLLIARDRLGIKPVYYTPLANGGVGFASEVRALARMGIAGEIDPQAILSYLQWGVVKGPSTILQNVYELPAGNYLRWTKGQFEITSWWDLARATRPPGSGVTSLHPLKGALRDSIKRHVVADRPVGIFLSSGTDSNAVARLTLEAGVARSLTVSFPEAGSEGARARELASRLGTHHEEVEILGAEVAEVLPRFLSSMDQPTFDGLNTWIVSRSAARAGLVVALSGLGGDELFGGYPSFRLIPRLVPILKVLHALPSSWRAKLQTWSSSRNPGGRAARVLGARSPDVFGAYAAVRGLLGPGEIPGVKDVPWEFPILQSGTIEETLSILETSNYMRDQLLRDTDQMSMSHSLEVRVPLLDDLVVERVLALGPSVRFAPGKRALALASGLGQPLPKLPFSLPFDTWLRGPLRDQMREGMLSEHLPFGALLPQHFRERVWQSYEAGRAHWSKVWAVTVLRNWPRMNLPGS